MVAEDEAVAVFRLCSCWATSGSFFERGLEGKLAALRWEAIASEVEALVGVDEELEREWKIWNPGFSLSLYIYICVCVWALEEVGRLTAD